MLICKKTIKNYAMCSFILNFATIIVIRDILKMFLL